ATNEGSPDDGIKLALAAWPRSSEDTRPQMEASLKSMAYSFVLGRPFLAYRRGNIVDALLSNDERRVLTWYDDNTLQVWDASTGEQIGSSMKHDGAINGALPVGDDGQRIL